MKKKIMITLSGMMVGAMLLSGCQSSGSTGTTAATTAAGTTAETTAVETTAAVEETTAAAQIANPWTESDAQGVSAATGFDMAAPEGAGNVAYSYMEDGAMAQMTYELDGASWVYRIQMADELTDISGMSYTWSQETEGSVDGRSAVCLSYTSDDSSELVRVVNWYDAVTGVTYSLSATGKDYSAAEMQTYAEGVYAPLQGEATGDDAEADSEAELQDFFLGEHVRSSDESTLTLTKNEDGTIDVDISITRLCSLENGVGTFEDHRITFTVQDPAENEMTGVIYLDSDNSLVVQITQSTWEYLETDEILDGFGK